MINATSSQPGRLQPHCGKRLIPSLLALSLLSTLAACGGDGYDSSSSASSTSSASSGTSTSAASITTTGVVTGFGSVYVNGVRYDTSSASFDINDDSGTQSDLRVGDVVKVHGRRDASGNSFADSVSFDDAVKGAIQSIDTTAGTLLVLGQTVIIDAETSFDDNISPASLSGLSVGTVVEVSGLRDAADSIHATRIEKKAAGTISETTGKASNVNTATHTLNINALLVNYASALIQDFPNGTPANGDLIEVRGSSFNTNGELLATRIELKAAGSTANGASSSASSSTSSSASSGTSSSASSSSSASEVVITEIEGFVTRFVSSSDFDISGQAATTNSATAFENGTAGDLQLNARIEVEGTLDASGVLVATKVKFKRAGSAGVSGVIEAVDSNAGTVTVLGVVVTVDINTRMEDKSNARLDSLHLTDLMVGDYIEVRGQELPANSNRVLAARLERDDLDSDRILRGQVDSVARPALTLLGVTIQTNAGTQYRDTADQPLTADSFFAGADGQFIKAKGLLNSGVFIASELEFEND